MRMARSTTKNNKPIKKDPPRYASPLMTLKEASEYLRMGYGDFRGKYEAMAANEGLKIVKRGRRVFILKHSLDEFISAHQVNW